MDVSTSEKREKGEEGGKGQQKVQMNILGAGADQKKKKGRSIK